MEKVKNLDELKHILSLWFYHRNQITEIEFESSDAIHQSQTHNES